MITKLPEWYKIAKVKSLTEETLQKRSDEIVKICKSKKFEWMQNVIRFFLNKPLPSEFSDEFIKIFLEGDPMFPQKNNALELRVLAGALLHEYVVTSKNKDQISVALALRSTLFGIDPKSLINKDIIETVLQLLAERSISTREKIKKEPIELSIEASATDIPAAVNSQFKKLAAYINDSVTRRTEILEEESNIHWWIFRSFSNDFGVPFKEIEFKQTPIIIGKELSDLINIIPGPIATEQFLLKLLQDNAAEEKEVLFKDVVNSISREYMEKFNGDFHGALGNLCPLHFSFLKAIESADRKSWVAPFQKITGLHPDKLRTGRVNLALQVCYEKLLLLSLK